MKQGRKKVITNYLINPKYRVYQHLLFTLAIVLLMTNNVYYNYKYLQMGQGPIISLWTVYVGASLIAFYLNTFVLVPAFLFKNHLLSYFLSLSLVVLLALVALGAHQIYTLGFDFLLDRVGVFSIFINLISSFLSLAFMLAGSTTIQLIKRWVKHNQRINELESETLHSELKLLKNQINPHFLFNMLNNANVLIWKNKEEAARVIFKLEDLLRYQLTVTHKEKVLLPFDIRFLNDFLNLEKIRRDKFECTIKQEGDIDSAWVPSLLFIAFVENAVKHNPDNLHLSYVYLSFKVYNNELEFTCENSKPVVKTPSKRPGGLGLKNIKRRLALLYPEEHSLDIRDDETTYTVKLNITL